jgi:nitrite reductase (NO-forming)
MNKEISPSFTSAVLIGFTVLILAVLLLRIEIVPNTVSAQETPATSQTTTVAHVETNVIEYTLRMQLGGDPAMAFVGVGGTIDGVVNPDLSAHVGDTVHLTVINGDPVAHDLTIDEFKVSTGEMVTDEQTVMLEFTVTQPGEFKYYCSVPGHRQIGMEGVLHVEGEAVADAHADDEGSAVTEAHDHEMDTVAGAAATDAVSIVRNPSDLPPPIGDREPTTVVVNLTSVELNGLLADGTTYHYMTFDGQVPGPMIRVLVGDTVEVHLKNDPASHLSHSIDLHSVTGPGGGAVTTQTLPGQETGFTFKALQPGLYVYHCATPSIGQHISSGMYGLVLVEPVGGLPPVDLEFYVMQGEIYTAEPFGTQGHLDFSYDMMLDEDAEYFVFNGAAGALTIDENALRANVGETVRIYFGVGGPNAISSFHVIGEIFDKVYDQASLTGSALTDVQTTLVPSGGATIVEFTLNVPGRYILVDHALSRLERGLAGYLYVEGQDDPAIFHSDSTVDNAGH